MLDPMGGPGYWHGSDQHLPSLPGTSERQILDHALTMPAVQELLREADRRGYLRRPEYDRAIVRNDPRVVAAFLALEKPGFSPPPGENGAPIVQITTADAYGTPRTASALCFVLVHEVTGAVRTADEEPTMPDDGTVEYLEGARRGGGAGPIRLHPEWQPTPLQKHCTKRYLVCAAAGNLACILQAIYPAEPWQVKVIRIAICVVTATTGCLVDFVDCIDPGP